MKKNRPENIIILSAVVLILIPLSCIHNSRETDCDYRFIVTIPEEISIEKSEMESATGYQKEGGKVAEIVVYSFSTGREVFSYSKDSGDDVRQVAYKGSMEVLVKTKENGIIKEIYFLKSEGDSRAELIKDIISKVKSILCK